MTALACELDRKLSELTAERARMLERLVRDAIALADSTVTGGSDCLNLEVQPLPMSAADYDHLAAALDQAPRALPRLRELLSAPGKLGHA